MRIALLALTGMAALQTVYFVLAAPGRTRAVGIVLGLGSLLLESWRGADGKRQVAAQAALGAAIVWNLTAHYPTLGEPIDARVLLAAVVLGYLGLLVAGAAALVRASLFLPVLLGMCSFGLAVVAAEVILRPPWRTGLSGQDLAWRNWEPHPDTTLPEFYRPGSQVIHPFPSNPRGYFERLDPSDIRWVLRLTDSAKAALVRDSADPGIIRIEIARAPTRTAWHIRLIEPGLPLTRGDRLALRFRARADRPRSLVVAVARGRPPWTDLGLRDTIRLDTAWRHFDIPGVAAATYPWGQLQFDAGGDRASVELRDVALVRIASGETIRPDVPPYAMRYAFNSMGCRDREVPLERPAGTVRILSLGDSYAMGVGVRPPDVFSARLERMLNDARSPGAPRYEVINCGVSGFSTEDARILYERHVARYHPDLVLLTLVWNDDRSWPDEVRMGFHERRRHALFESWRLLDNALARWRLSHHDYPGVLRSLQGLRRAVEAQGARLAVIIGRNQTRREWDALTDAVHGSVDTLALPVLNVWDRLKTEPEDDLVVLDGVDHHPSERAHALIAEEVRRFLEEKGLLHPRRDAGAR